MCVSNIENVAALNLFTHEEKVVFVSNVIIGTVSVENLDVNQYLKIARKLSESIEDGFGKKLEELPGNSEDWLLLRNLIDSGYEFAAAKQYQLVREILELLKEKEFKDKEEMIAAGVEVFDKYNERYLKPEVVNVGLQAASAVKFKELVKWGQT